MRIIITTLVLALIFSTSYSQGIVEVRGVNESMSQGSKDGLRVSIPEATVKDVEKLWKKELKDLKGKVSTPKDEIFGDDATIGQISANTIDVYSKVVEIKNGAALTVFFDLGGAYLNSSHAGFGHAQKMLYKFGVDAAKDAVSQQVAIEEKKLKDLEGEQEQLVKDKERLDKDIEKWMSEIDQAKKDLKNNLADQEKNKASIGNQVKELGQVQEKLKNIK